jgi:4-hydroxy-3-methylbut-2-enyl diphosphate reductase IspH
MIVEIDPYSGFCSGVKKAIERAEKELEKGETVY